MLLHCSLKSYSLFNLWYSNFRKTSFLPPQQRSYTRLRTVLLLAGYGTFITSRYRKIRKWHLCKTTSPHKHDRSVLFVAPAFVVVISLSSISYFTNANLCIYRQILRTFFWNWVNSRIKFSLTAVKPTSGRKKKDGSKLFDAVHLPCIYAFHFIASAQCEYYGTNVTLFIACTYTSDNVKISDALDTMVHRRCHKLRLINL